MVKTLAEAVVRVQRADPYYCAVLYKIPGGIWIGQASDNVGALIATFDKDGEPDLDLLSEPEFLLETQVEWLKEIELWRGEYERYPVIERSA